jgi:hypothetical protein
MRRRARRFRRGFWSFASRAYDLEQVFLRKALPDEINYPATIRSRNPGKAWGFVDAAGASAVASRRARSIRNSGGQISRALLARKSRCPMCHVAGRGDRANPHALPLRSGIPRRTPRPHQNPGRLRWALSRNPIPGDARINFRAHASQVVVGHGSNCSRTIAISPSRSKVGTRVRRGVLHCVSCQASMTGPTSTGRRRVLAARSGQTGQPGHLSPLSRAAEGGQRDGTGHTPRGCVPSVPLSLAVWCHFCVSASHSHSTPSNSRTASSSRC